MDYLRKRGSPYALPLAELLREAVVFLVRAGAHHLRLDFREGLGERRLVRIGKERVRQRKQGLVLLGDVGPQQVHIGPQVGRDVIDGVVIAFLGLGEGFGGGLEVDAAQDMLFPQDGKRSRIRGLAAIFHQREEMRLLLGVVAAVGEAAEEIQQLGDLARIDLVGLGHALHLQGRRGEHGKDDLMFMA